MFKPLPRLNLTPFSVLFRTFDRLDCLNITTRESAIFGRVSCHDCLMLSVSLIIVLPEVDRCRLSIVCIRWPIVLLVADHRA